MKNVQAAISPLLNVLCICGLGVFEYPERQPRLYLTILYILISWFLYIYIMFNVFIFLQKFALELPVIIKTSIIFAVLYILLNLYFNKKFKNCLNKLSIVNDTLEELGTPKNYPKLRIQIIRLIIGWIVLMFLLDMFDILNISKTYFVSSPTIIIYLPLIVNHSLHINMLYDLTYLMLLRYIGSLFNHVNQHIQELTKQKKRKVRHAWTTSTSSLIHRHMAGSKTSNRIICILMHLHLELCIISHELTMIFGLQIVMQAVAFYVFSVQLISECYREFMKVNSDPTHGLTFYIFDLYIWVLTNIVKMIVFNYICEGVCTKANSTEMFLNRLTNLMFDVETQENITQFLLQLLWKPLRISGLGFFYFGYKFVHECVNYIAMIIVFVLQAHSPSS